MHTLVGDDDGLVNSGEALVAVDVDLFLVEETSADLVESLEDFCGDRLGLVGVTAFGVVAMDILRAGVCSFLLAIDFLVVTGAFLLTTASLLDFRLFLLPFSGNRDV